MNVFKQRLQASLLKLQSRYRKLLRALFLIFGGFGWADSRRQDLKQLARSFEEMPLDVVMEHLHEEMVRAKTVH